MIFAKHYGYESKHSFLSPSKYYWIRYDDHKLSEAYRTDSAAKRGSELHDLAAKLIKLKQKLPRSNATLNAYVNDAIGFRMTPEQCLMYSDNCFGTCDAISFRKNVLRIHDLKTGVTPASMDQLMVYAALFCLEYKTKPHEIDIELRIYQNDECIIHNPDPEDVVYIIDKIIHFDKLINNIKLEEE